MWILSFKNWKVNTLPSKNIQTKLSQFIYYSLVLRKQEETKPNILHLNVWSPILKPGFGATLSHSKLYDVLLFSDIIHLCNLCCKLLYFFVLRKLWPNDKFGKREQKMENKWFLIWCQVIVFSRLKHVLSLWFPLC